MRGIAENDIAIDVKLADLTHNMDSSRLQGENKLPNVKYEIYRSSKEFLMRAKLANARSKIIK